MSVNLSGLFISGCTELSVHFLTEMYSKYNAVVIYVSVYSTGLIVCGTFREFPIVGKSVM